MLRSPQSAPTQVFCSLGPRLLELVGAEANEYPPNISHQDSLRRLGDSRTRTYDPRIMIPLFTPTGLYRPFRICSGLRLSSLFLVVFGSCPGPVVVPCLKTIETRGLVPLPLPRWAFLPSGQEGREREQGLLLSRPGPAPGILVLRTKTPGAGPLPLF